MSWLSLILYIMFILGVILLASIFITMHKTDSEIKKFLSNKNEKDE